MGAVIAYAVKGAIMRLVSQGVQIAVKSLLKRLYAVAQMVLAKYPALVPALCVIVASFLARFGFHVSATELAYVASAVAAVVGALTHASVKAVERKSTSNEE